MMFSNLGGSTLFGHTWDSLPGTDRFYAGCLFRRGIPLGLLLGISETASAILRPLVDVFRPMPPLAWISLSILWFGIGEEPKIFIIFLASFIPSVLNACWRCAPDRARTLRRGARDGRQPLGRNPASGSAGNHAGDFGGPATLDHRLPGWAFWPLNW